MIDEWVPLHWWRECKRRTGCTWNGIRAKQCEGTNLHWMEPPYSSVNQINQKDVHECKCFNPKNCSKLSKIWSGMVIPDPDLDFWPIPDPGSRGQKGTGSRIQIHNSGGNKTKRLWYLRWLTDGSSLFSPGPGGWSCGPRGTWPASCTGRTYWNQGQLKKGTGSRDRIEIFWRKRTYLGIEPPSFVKI